MVVKPSAGVRIPPVREGFEPSEPAVRFHGISQKLMFNGL